MNYELSNAPPPCSMRMSSCEVRGPCMPLSVVVLATWRATELHPPWFPWEPEEVSEMVPCRQNVNVYCRISMPIFIWVAGELPKCEVNIFILSGRLYTCVVKKQQSDSVWTNPETTGYTEHG